MHSSTLLHKSKDVVPDDILSLAISTGGFLLAQQAISKLVLKPISRYFLPSPEAESPPIRDYDSAIDLEEIDNSSFGTLPDSELDLPPTPPSRDADGQPPPDFSLINNHISSNGIVNTSNSQCGDSNGTTSSPTRTQQQLGQLVASALPDPLMLTEYDLKRNIPLRNRKRIAPDGSAVNNNANHMNSKINKDESLSNPTPSTFNAMARRHAAKALKDDRRKFQVASWKLLYTSFVSTLGLIALSQETWFFDPSQYFQGWPDKVPPMSHLMKFYYIVSFGNYTAQAISIFFEPKLKDFWQMFFHHIITCNLIFFSYWVGLYRAGAVIVLLHDVSDPWMELAKCFHYSNNELFANFFFAMFAACFIYTRNWLFPRYIIYGITQYAYTENGIPMPNGPMNTAFLIGLCLLEALHIFWATLIIGMIKEALSAGGVKGDARDMDD